MKSSLLWIAITAGLAGCDLTEAGRMDLEQGRVRSMKAGNATLLFHGKTEVFLTEFAQSLLDGSWSHAWTLDQGDRGTEPSLVAWRVDLLFHEERLATTRNDFGGPWMDPDLLGMVLQDPGGLRVRCQDASGETALPADFGSVGQIRLIDDRAVISIEGGWDSVRKCSRGDTLTLVARNSTDSSMGVWTDLSGVRTLDEYLVRLDPGATARFRWVVTAPSGSSGWVELGWGPWGAVRRFHFGVR